MNFIAKAIKSRKPAAGVSYCCQDRNFNKCLLIICWLVFDDFHSKKTICFCNPAFSNLPKGTMPKNFFDNVPTDKKCLSLLQLHQQMFC